MVCSFVGIIQSRDNLDIYIKDLSDGNIVQTRALNDETFDLDIGTSGVFIGELKDNVFYVKRYEVKKFLDPLHEDDLMNVTGKIVLTLIDDPFPEIYKSKEELNIKIEEYNKSLEQQAQEA
jgi:hypothetical protein